MKLVISGQYATSDGVDVQLPAVAGTLANPPSVTVYQALFSTGPYITVSDGYSSTSTYWGLYQASEGLQVRIRKVIAGMYFTVVVIY